MSLWTSIDELKNLSWVELSHQVNNDSPYWSGFPDGSIELGAVINDFDSNVLSALIQTFKFPGQFGTHVDFPAHFDPKGAFSQDYSQRDLVFPLVVIDISNKAACDADYELTIADIEEHERRHGKIPAGSFVALRTDWYKRWPDGDALANLDANGSEHAPGWTVETIRYLLDERDVETIGHETLDTDASVGAERAGDLVAERYILTRGKVQVELLANLDKVPPTGAVLFAAVPRIEGATGLPARVWAIFEG